MEPLSPEHTEVITPIASSRYNSDCFDNAVLLAAVELLVALPGAIKIRSKVDSRLNIKIAIQ